MCIYLCKRHAESLKAGHKRKQKQQFERATFHNGNNKWCMQNIRKNDAS